MSTPVDSVDRLSDKIDKCITNGIIKFGGGTLVGAVSSLLFLGRRSWPIIMGAGVGLGIAYASCETDLNKSVKSENA